MLESEVNKRLDRESEVVDETEKRNTTGKTTKPCGDERVAAEGVGGRQADSPPHPGGGGYLNICKILKFQPEVDEKKIDPRLEELKKMGLQHAWIRVAETIGFDSFLSVWRILDADPASYGGGGRLEIPLRAYSSYLRYQRNRYIETLTGMGCDAKQIRDRLKEQLREKISLRHISRIQKRG